MNLFARAREFIIRRTLQRTARQLSLASEAELIARVPERVLEVFRHAARLVPGYAEILDRSTVPVGRIVSLQDFQRLVPVLDKESWFGREYQNISAADQRDNVASFFSSSGQSGFFSMGTETRAEQKKAALFLEFALQQAFRALDRKTFLINCLSMGVRVHTRTIPLAETSVREDVVLALLKKLSAEFDQFVLLGEHLFLKLVVEQGLDQSDPVDWKALCVHVITGAEFIPENFRTYLAGRMGIDPGNPDGGSININYGLSEITASIAHENWHTIQIRRLAHQDEAFRRALCGEDYGFCPALMQYHPSQVYLETDHTIPERPELLVTVLDTQRVIPIIRYNTKDRARTITHSELSSVLRAFGRDDLVPPTRLPGLLLWGKCKGLPDGATVFYPEQVKEALYADAQVAAALTGNFRLSRGQSHPKVSVQLREGQLSFTRLKATLGEELTRYCSASVELEVLAYRDFPHGIRHDFERKSQYLVGEGEAGVR